MTRRVDRIAMALGLLTLLVVLVPALLVAVARARFGSPSPLAGVDPFWRWDLARLRDAATGQLSDDAVIELFIRTGLVVIWLAIATMIVTTVAETVHMVRHDGIVLPSVRGLRWAQPMARLIAVGLIAVAPFHHPRTSLASTSGDAGRFELRSTGSTTELVAPEMEIRPTGQSRDAEDAAPDRIHVVRRGESIYSIASQLAGGDPERTVRVADAILDVNLGRTMSNGGRFTNPAYIEVGWELTLPAAVVRDAVASTGVADGADVHVVERGDTLSAIAEEHLGDASEWPRLWEANAGREMGDGRTLDDADLILPGWSIRIPGSVIDDVVDTDPDTPTPAPPADLTTPGSGSEDATDADTGQTEPPDTDAATPPTDAATPPTDVATPPTDVAASATDPGKAETADADADVSIGDARQPTDVDASEPTVSGSDTVGSPAVEPDTERVDATTAGGPTPGRALDGPDAGARSGTTTTVAGTDTGRPIGDGGTEAPERPAPIGIEHAAVLAAGVLALVGIRRRQRLRSALPRARVPEPRAAASAMERRLRIVDPGERAQRVDVSLRAAAANLVGAGVQIGLVIVAADGAITLHLTGDGGLPAPWSGEGSRWTLPAATPIEDVSDAARLVGTPCLALAQIGVTPEGGDVLADLEACPALLVEGEAETSDRVVTGLTASLAASPYAEVAHLVTVSVDDVALLDHRNAHIAGSADIALELAASLVGGGRAGLGSSFELRSMRTGGEVWEPAVVLLRFADGAGGMLRAAPAVERGSGIAIVAAVGAGDTDLVGCRLTQAGHTWTFDGFGTSIPLAPVGLTTNELDDLAALLGAASEPLGTPDAPTVPSTDAGAVTIGGTTSCFEPLPHAIVVGLLGDVRVTDSDGNAGAFERSKTVELIAWLATHRERSTRTAARTALWELDVRDATFANVVSEARRGLARLVPPPDDEEWLARTLNEHLPLHELVVTDAQLVERRLDAARLQPPGQAMDTLRPAVEMIRGIPFAGTSYLWPDAEGLTSSLVLLAIGAAAELAGHALSEGDIDTVFWATGRGLAVLPGHEELIALRMRAHARAGDHAGVRQEWESYERVIVADAWSDGEPAPKLVALRHELLSSHPGVTT